jgi:hypothetical protein
MSLPARRAALVLLVVLTASQGACVRQMVAGAVDSATATQSQQQLAALLDNDRMRAAIDGLGRSLLLGSLDGLSDKEMDAKVQAATADFVHALVPVLTDSLHQEIGPAVQAELAASVQAALSQALSDQNRRNAQGFASAVVQATMTTLRQSLGDAVVYDLGPALQIVLESNLGPGVNAMLVNDVGPALDEVLTFDVLPPVTSALDVQRGLLVRDLDKVVNRGQETLRTVSEVVTGIASILLVLLVTAGYFLLKVRRENDVRERAVVLLARQIHHRRDAPGTHELVRSIRDAAVSSDEGAYLSELLRRYEALKVQVPDDLRQAVDG